MLRAKVNYRRFIKEYADYVAAEFKEAMPNPTVEMAQSETCLITIESLPKINADIKSGKEKGRKNIRRVDDKTERETVKLFAHRWNDYGIGLLGQLQYGAASEAFRKASEMNPSDASFPVNAAIAELQTERYGPERVQLGKAKELLEKAAAVDPENNRAKYYFALVRRSEGAAEEAAGILAKLALEYPNDREIQRQLGQTFYRLGRFDEARTAFFAINRIDPTDAGAYQFLSPLFAGAGLLKEAEVAQRDYFLWRDDPLADAVANRFYASHPEWADARVPGKIYSFESPDRNVNTGENAAGER